MALAQAILNAARMEAMEAIAAMEGGGELQLKDVSVRYGPILPLALRSINLHVPKHTKVGVCGRTGAHTTAHQHH